MTYEDTLASIAASDERLVVMTAENRAVIRGLPPKLGDRFIDVGISEMTLVGAAAGLALRGRRPVIHALATFLTMRAFEFIRTDVGIPSLPVTIVGGFPGFLSTANGPTHQAIEDIALMRGIPNMQVFCPADSHELIAGLPAIIDSGKPCYLRYCDNPPQTEHADFEIGKAEVLSEGSDVAILSYGLMLEQALLAKTELEAKGASVHLVNMRMLEPVDEAAIVAAAKAAPLVVTVEDHFERGGLYTIATEVLHRHGSATPVKPMGLNQRWYKPTLLPQVLEHEQLTGAHIASRVLREIR